MTAPGEGCVEHGGSWRRLWTVRVGPVFGGGWSILQGCTGLPLKPADGRTVLVPTREPAALRTALLTAKGTLGS